MKIKSYRLCSFNVRARANKRAREREINEFQRSLNERDMQLYKQEIKRHVISYSFILN